MGLRMIETGLLAAVGTLALTLLLGFFISILIRKQSASRRFRLGISTSMLAPWLVVVFVLLVFLLWRLIGRSS